MRRDRCGAPDAKHFIAFSALFRTNGSKRTCRSCPKKNWLKERLDEGLVFLSSKKKTGFLSDPGYMRHRGFVTADAAEPSFALLYLPFTEEAERPRFRDTVREHGGMPGGFVLYYTDQCPFTAKYHAA